MTHANYSSFECNCCLFPDVGEDLLAMCEQNVALNKHLMELGSKSIGVSVCAITYMWTLGLDSTVIDYLAYS